MPGDIETRARFAIAEWTDCGDEMSAEEFRRCVALVLAYSDDEAAVIVNHASAAQRDALPGVLVPHGCGWMRMLRIIDEARAEKRQPAAQP